MTDLELPPTVWVVNDAGHEVEDGVHALLPTAVIRALTLGDVNPLRVDRLCQHLARGIAKYAKEDDYVLLSGYQMINAMAVHLWITQFRKINILQWNAKHKRYELTRKKQEDFENLLQRELER